MEDNAALALIAGKGLPAWFRVQSARQGPEIAGLGAALLLFEKENLLYRNVHVAGINNTTAGMRVHQRPGFYMAEHSGLLHMSDTLSSGSLIMYRHI